VEGEQGGEHAMSFTGILLAESLRKEAVLDGVPFIVQRMWRRDAGDPAARQPLTWTFIMFEVPAASAGLFAERLSTALTSGPWYCDLHDADETIVVFAGQIFRYARGDQHGRESAEAHARTVGVPEVQIDWPE
jgi:hypothetical protein